MRGQRGVRQLAGRLRGVATNFPDGKFDPIKASPGDLKRHCLPLPPDQDKMPVAYANWVRAMASRPHFPIQSAVKPGGVQEVLIFTHPNASTSQETSKNWSGAVVRPRSLGKIMLVQGRWIVPDTPPYMGGQGFASSVWVGFDGHDPTSRVIPQIGTGQLAHTYKLPDATGNLTIPYPLDIQFAWWQIWLRDTNQIWETKIQQLPVSRGDKIFAQVQVFDETKLSFYIRNETINRAYCCYYDLNQHHPGYRIERRTAEWIVERPLIPDTIDPTATSVQPIIVALAKYGETAFTDCNVVTNEGSSFDEFQLQRANLIRMNLWDDPTNPGRLASRAERVSDDAVLMRYVDAP